MWIFLFNSDEFLICPYNKAHVLIRHRMPKHIAKCCKNYNGEPLTVCPYNAMHMVPQQKLATKTISSILLFLQVPPRQLIEHLKDCADHLQNKVYDWSNLEENM